jgi:hypothetical protein
VIVPQPSALHVNPSKVFEKVEQRRTVTVIVNPLDGQISEAFAELSACKRKAKRHTRSSDHANVVRVHTFAGCTTDQAGLSSGPMT